MSKLSQEIDKCRRFSQSEVMDAIIEITKHGIDISELCILDAVNIVSVKSGEAHHDVIGLVSSMQSVIRQIKRDI